MDYLVFAAVLVAGLSALSGLVAHIKKGVASAQEFETESFKLIKEYLEASLMKGDLDIKIEIRSNLKARMQSHVDQVLSKQRHKKEGKVIKLSEYLKK